MTDLLLTVAAWGAAIAGCAAGMKGLGYLIRTGRFGFRQTRRAAVAVGKLAAIGAEDAWPNGSKDLPTFLEWVYQSIQKLLDYHQEELFERETGVKTRRGS
jgi:hypothetical protein